MFYPVVVAVLCIANASSSSGESTTLPPPSGGTAGGLGELSSDSFDHVVVIPDVHGDADAFIVSLYGSFGIVEPHSRSRISLDRFRMIFMAAVNDEPLEGVPLSSAAPMSVALVQLGDLVDRGPYSVRCMDIALKIETVIGWSVTILQGNHEIERMLKLDERYIHREEQGLVGLEGMQEMVYDRLATVGLAMARFSGSNESSGMRLEDPRNPNTLFVHAGIDLPWLRSVIDSNDVCEINEKFRQDIWDEAKLQRWNEPESPMWTRHYLTIDSDPFGESYCDHTLRGVLKHFGVARIIVGHMPQPDGVITRCDGKIIIADITMSAWMKRLPGGGYGTATPGAVIMTMDKSSDGKALASIIEHHWDTDGDSMLMNQIWPLPPPRRLRSDSGESVESLDVWLVGTE